jgi:hypothetical protein
VPGVLARLPLDPYSSGRPFGYVPSDGKSLLPLRDAAEDLSPGVGTQLEPTRPGQWLLYSVAPDRLDQRARINYLSALGPGDFVFPLPDRSRRPGP